MVFNKNFVVIMMVCLLVVLAACTAPPEDAPRASVGDSDNSDAGNEPADTGSDETQNVEPGTEHLSDGEKDIDAAASTFMFEGYGPGKSHEGKFTDFTGTITMKDGVVVAAQGTVQADSVDTGISGLDDHLKAADFFDVAQFPTMSFSGTIADGQMTGDLTFRGVTKEISFPVVVDGHALSADFVLDSTPFGMENTAVNKEVRIFFTMTA